MAEGAANAQESALRKYHPWVNFNPGSWSQVRQVTETINENGVVTGATSTETKTTLQQISADGVTIKIEAIVEVAGKRLASAPQVVKQGFAEETSGQTLTVKEADGSELSVDGQKISCRSEQAEVIGGGQKRIISLCFSDKAPYIFRKVSTTTDLPSGAIINETVSEVVARDMPQKVLNDIFQAAHVKTQTKHQQGTTISLSVLVESVPGAVVSQTSKKLDPQGRVVRRSTLELIDYRIAPPSSGAEEGRLRARRHRQRR
jgi:hypothetical protein